MTTHNDRSAVRVLGGAFVLALLAVVCWWAFLGWDTTYDVDPVTGSTTGPYGVPQVAGCVLVLVALTAAGASKLPAWLAVAAVALPFTAAWSAWAARHDASGLWAVGAALVLIGTVAGGGLVAAVTRFVLKRRSVRV
jgi:hypothetical protein